MTWPALTPLEFAVLDVITAVVLIAIIGGFLRALGWAFRGVARLRDIGPFLDEMGPVSGQPGGICELCRGYSRTAPCTCPDGGCLTPTCPQREVRRG
jgi:hypothetical protein